MFSNVLGDTPFARALIELAKLWRVFHSPCFDFQLESTLGKLEARVFAVVAAVEANLPPTERCMMLHAVTHLPRQMWLWGVCRLHWMFPVDSMLGRIKRYALSTVGPEANMMRMVRFDVLSHVLPFRFPRLFRVCGGESDSDPDASSSTDSDKDSSDISGVATLLPVGSPLKFRAARPTPWRASVTALNAVSFRPYADNTNYRRRNDRVLDEDELKACCECLPVPPSAVSTTARQLLCVSVGPNRLTVHGRTRARRHKAYSRAAVALARGFDGRFGLVLDILHVSPLGADGGRVPIGERHVIIEVNLFSPGTVRVRRQHRSVFVLPDQLGHVVALSPQPDHSFDIIECNHPVILS
jgi:hypothetical protein